MGIKDFSINQLPTEPSEIVRIIKNLCNAAAGHVDVKACVLKHVADIIALVLSYLINLSLKLAIVLHTLKRAVVSLVFKAKQRDNIKNYWPLSILSMI